MMKKYLYIVFLCSPLALSAQKVVDAESGEAIIAAVVQLLDKAYNPIDYTTTNHEGEFRAFEQEGTWLKFTSMGYRTDTIAVTALPDTLALTPQTFTIKEVTVKAPPIRLKGDTISYNVANFANESDRTIADVLRKMPGVEVSESGAIEYNGTPINKFYIEGADMMDSRYGIATNSISSEDVAAVDIMENHQAVKALDGVAFSDKAAVNLRLKEDAKVQWTGYAEVGGGYPKLYRGDAAAMSFSKRFQSINTLKANNTGEDVTTQTASLSITEMIASNENQDEITDFLSVVPHQLAHVDTHTGNNEAVSSNFLTKLSPTSDLKGNVTMTNSHLSYEQEHTTSYFVQDSTLQIVENEQSTAHTCGAAASLTYTQNASEFYLRNTLKGDYARDDISLDNTGSYTNEQVATISNQKYSNSFELIKRIGKRTLNISSYNAFSTKPQQLTVVDNFSERIATTLFTSHSKAAYSFRVKRWNLFAQGGVHYYMHSINDKAHSYTKLHFAPRAEYRSRKDYVVTIDAPLNYYAPHDAFMPSLHVYAKLPVSARWAISASTGLTSSQMSNSHFYNGVIRSDYRTVNYGISEFLPQHSLYAILGFAYKDPFTQFFLNGSAQYSGGISPFIRSQTFEDELMINRFVKEDSRNSSFLAKMNVGKGYRGGRVSLGVSYTRADDESLQNESRLQYRLHQIGASVSANKKVTNWFSGEYTGQFYISALNDWSNDSWSLNQSAELIFSPVKGLNLQVMGTYHLTDKSDLFLLGAEVMWKINKRWELSLDATNLLNHTHYLVEQLSGTAFHSTRYHIRPRSISASVLVRF